MFFLTYNWFITSLPRNEKLRVYKTFGFFWGEELYWLMLRGLRTIEQCFSTFFSTRNPFDLQKIPRNPFATQKNYGQPLIYWYKAFLYKLGNCIVKMTQIPSEHIKKEWIKTEMLGFFKFGGTPRRPLRNPGWETLP